MDKSNWSLIFERPNRRKREREEEKREEEEEEEKKKRRRGEVTEPVPSDRNLPATPQ